MHLWVLLVRSCVNAWGYPEPLIELPAACNGVRNKAERRRGADRVEARHWCEIIRVQNKFVISPVSLPWISSVVQNAAQAAGLGRWSNGDDLNRELEKLQQGAAFHCT